MGLKKIDLLDLSGLIYNGLLTYLLDLTWELRQ
jgi:hypothetical protein